MPSKLPQWLLRQACEDMDALARGFSGTERELRDAGLPRLAGSIRSFRRAVLRLRQDLAYAWDFLNGQVRRRGVPNDE